MQNKRQLIMHGSIYRWKLTQPKFLELLKLGWSSKVWRREQT